MLSSLHVFCFLLTLTVCQCWHDLSNVEFHCWPFGADDDKPTAFAVCYGVDMDWIVPPPSQILENEPFNTSFSLILSPEFYTWAVQDAQDHFKTAQEWCEQSKCPERCSDATQENCCMHHVNVHSCPVDEVKFGLCPPWVPADGNFYTHSVVNCGTALQTIWTAELSGLQLKGGKITSTALIAHFKVATMHLALNWMVTVLPRSACGDDKCDEGDGEDCTTCPNDCGKCPISSSEISAIAVVSCILVLLAVAGIAYMKYSSNKLLWDESWIVNYSDIKPAVELLEQTGVGTVSAGNNTNSIPDYARTPIHSTSLVAGREKLELGLYKGEVYVLKRIAKKGFKLTKKIRTEVRQLRRLDHANLLSFVGACVKIPKVLILSKYCSKGNLTNVLKAKNIPLNWAFRFSFATDIVSGMSYLHSHEMWHGRLSMENCLVDDRWGIKLSDFGVPSLRSTDTNLSTQQLHKGSELWRAPELKPGEASYEGDIFSYGIILIQIATRADLPLKKADDVNKLKMDWNNALSRNELGSEEPCPCPGPLGVVVDSCLVEKASLRPSAALVKKQVKNINPNKMNAVDLMMTMMERYSKHLELMVAEKTHDLLAEKQRTDELLHAMLPKQVADDLRMGRPVNADVFESCTVYFSDIVGFTSLSGKMSAMDVVIFLNKLYSCFDRVIDKHDVYKVETIGDAYMVVSGVPIRNGNRHVTNIADMALDLLKETKTFIIPNMPDEPLKIRIGLHSGPVCAGVVGLKMPRYCLFGDTVNTASRMESTGEAYKIHMSNDTKDYLVIQSSAEQYRITARGTISVKGKGELNTWWLDGKAEQTSVLPPSTHMLSLQPPDLVRVSIDD